MNDYLFQYCGQFFENSMQVAQGQSSSAGIYLQVWYFPELPISTLYSHSPRNDWAKTVRSIASVEFPKKTIALTEKRYKAVSYFTNNHQLMNYHQALKRHWPIGSGVTEVTCKALIKKRLCGSGMSRKAPLIGVFILFIFTGFMPFAVNLFELAH